PMTALPSPTLPAHGAQIPALGFGTSPMTGGLSLDTVVAALHAGYRHIDTAWKYGTERAVGEAMRASGVSRGDIFLTTKVSHEYLRADAFAKSVDESLAALQVDYVDLLMVHWPNPEIPLAETMPALAKAKERGLARHIGVANFNIALLDQAIKLCPEPLVALQAEYHPYLDQSKLLAAVRQRGMVFTAYCPLGRGRLFSDPVLAEIAKARGKSIQDSAHDRPGRSVTQASTHDVIGVGIAFSIAGLYFMLGAAGYLPMPEGNSPAFIAFCAGAAFLFAGLTCMVRARAGMLNMESEIPDSAPRWTQVSYRILA